MMEYACLTASGMRPLALSMLIWPERRTVFSLALITKSVLYWRSPEGHEGQEINGESRCRT
jgi:hypothetical protein